MDELIQKLSILTGSWKGEGSGRYPTIDSFEYEEHLNFELDRSYPLIYYEQKTVLMPSEEPGHWETGFIRPLEDGFVEVSNAQEGGRVEVLQGKIETDNSPEYDLKIVLDSTALGNDPRLIKTRRIWTLKAEYLHYKKYMSTNTTREPQLLPHLEATLKREVEEERSTNFW